MTKIICPNCEVFNDTEGAFGEGEPLDYWMDNDGVFHWTCMECDHSWEGDCNGKRRNE